MRDRFWSYHVPVCSLNGCCHKLPLNIVIVPRAASEETPVPSQNEIRQQVTNQIVEALKKRGVDVEYMVKENEGHGFHNEENRFSFYKAMEKFLTKHLEPAKS